MPSPERSISPDDLPPRPWIYDTPRFDFKPDESFLSPEYQALLQRARSGDVGFQVPEVDFQVGEVEDDARSIMEQVNEAIRKVRTLNFPLAGARLHVGEDVEECLKSLATPHHDSVAWPISLLMGLPVVVEEGNAGLVELRWTIRA